MSAQITASITFSLELVALAVGLSILVGAVDLIRQPQWAWKLAEENKAAYLVLVVLVPIIGLGLYVVRARPHVVAAASGQPAGRPAAEAAGAPDRQPSPGGMTASAGFREMATFDGDDDAPEAGATPLQPSEPVEISSTFFSSGTATRTRVRPYRPRQRTSLDESLDARPTAPAGWNVDPTDRHQFRYWDGLHWTENVADGDRQSRDQVYS
jgi:Protein of unknown function (DUF2510)